MGDALNILRGLSKVWSRWEQKSEAVRKEKERKM